MSSYKVLIYVALVVLVMQIATSDAAPRKTTSGPAQCKANYDSGSKSAAGPVTAARGRGAAGTRVAGRRSPSPSGRSGGRNARRN